MSRAVSVCSGRTAAMDARTYVGTFVITSVLLVAWARFGWGSVRRIPGADLHEDVSGAG
jgi:hypothetical protein